MLIKSSRLRGSKLANLTVFFIISTFLITPLAPILAQESDLTASTSVEPTTTEEPATAPGEVLGTTTETPPAEGEPLPELTPEEKEKKDKKIKDEEIQALAASVITPIKSLTEIAESSGLKLVPGVDNLTGALIYEYEIQIPPGRNKMTPDVSLIYNSATSNNDSIIGAGWSINIPYIERINKKGSDKLYTDDYFSSSMDGELISPSAGVYAARVENGSFLKYALSNNVWTVTDKEGTVYKFGTNATERQDNSADTTKVYKWMLQEVRDTNDNYITYEYYKDAGQIYPSKITYTSNGVISGIFTVNFVRESRINGPTFYNTGFSVRSNYRISEINTEVNNVWARKYTLAYTTGDNSSGSLLDTIVESGKDDSSIITTLPEINFNYTTSATDWTYNSSIGMPLSFTNSGTDVGMRTADINGDGLVDVLCHSDQTNGTCERTAPAIYLNNGDGTWTNVSSTWLFPTMVNDATKREAFLDSSGNDSGLRTVDVNGDLKVDLVRAKGSTNYVYINNGSGWTHDSSWTVPSRGFINDSGVDYGFRMADINGDSLPDIMCHSDSINGNCERTAPEIYLNNGSGWTNVSSTWLFPPMVNDTSKKEAFLDSSLADAGLRTVDVNGDGLADLVRGKYPNKYIYLNNGSGWTYDSSWTLPTQGFVNSSGADYGFRMADINGDGLPDVLCHNDATNGSCSRSNPEVYLNNGTSGWVDVSSTWVFPPKADDATKTEVFLDASLQDVGMRIFDINGDGIDDLVRGHNSSTKYTYVNNKDTQSNLLTQMVYPQGGNTTITYKATQLYKDGSNNLLNPVMPIVLDTVSQISTSDGLGTTEAHNYEYLGGEYYFNNYLNKKLAGFASITDTNSASNVKKTYYYQGNTTNTALGEYDDHVSKIGKAYRVEEYDNASNLYNLTVDKLDKYNIGTDHDFVKIIRRTALNYDGNTDHADSASEYTYDNVYGNLTEQINWGKVTGSTDGSFTDTGTDKSTETITYVANTGNYVVGLPYQNTVVDQSSNKIRESKIYYDTLTLGSVGDGNPTKVEDWVTGSTYINNQKAYNTTYGILTSETDPRGKVTSYSYDGYNLYPATKTDPLSQTTQYVYDYSLGRPKQITDQNGFIYQTVYDGLDRVTAEKIPDFTTPYSAITKTAYTYTDTSGAVKVQKTDYLDSSTTADTYQYFDGLGRLIQERKEAETSGNFNVRDTVYNNIGLVQKTSLPYTSSGSAKTSATGTTSLYITNTYDALKRPSTTVDATGTTSYAYDDWKTTVTDKNSKVKKYYKDAYNNLIKVDEVNGASTYTTNYEWNLNNKLTKITDALSNIRNFTYDGLGRRLTAEDLHASADGTFGTWTYTYDNSGNLTQSVSPRSLTTNYTYNDINQQLTEDYTGEVGTEITYTYGGCTNGVEKLCSVTMASGANTAYTYDSNGNLTSETKTINSVAYTTSYTYDRQGNKLVITYPDSAEARYTFNSAGLLNQIERKESGGLFTNVISNIDYSPLDQATVQTYTNTVTTTNTYDATKMYRLTRKYTVGVGSSSNSNPTITLTGSNLINLTVGGAWSEPGYSASDTEDGILTSSVTVTGSVDPNTVGTYQLVYAVVDSGGLPAARKIRTVVVGASSMSTMTLKTLVVAGGGGAGNGGGGGGGVLYNPTTSLTAGNYSVTVGAGGVGYSGGIIDAQKGGNSSIIGNSVSIISIGGGGGGSGSPYNGGNGGSGGGASINGTAGTGTTGQGNNGGEDGGVGYPNDSYGGGGGAGAPGTNGNSGGVGGNGGAGIANSISGTLAYYGGGGGGWGRNGFGSGGIGGGGNSGSSRGVDGTPNTGGGGGGGGASPQPSGGSGIVVIAYKTDGSNGVSNTSTGGTVTTSGGDTIHTFNSSGTFGAVSAGNANSNPVITLSGLSLINLEIGAAWTEPGYSATDTEDGNLTSSVTITGSVNTAVAGTYQLVYSVVDSGGAPAARQIRTIVVANSSSSNIVLQDLNYTYDNNGNITQIVDASNTNSSKTVAYTYDDLNRMLSATATGVAGGQSTYTHTYTYNAIGNISTGPIGSYTYAGTGYANPHAATTINGVTYTYDNNGNLTGNGTLSNTFNYKDQMTQAIAGGVTSNYTYDHNGERASLANGTTTIVYPTDLYNTDGTKKTKQIYAGKDLVATIETVGGVVTPYYDHVDHLGSVSTTSDSSGALVETMDYFPFGNARISSSPGQRQYVGEIFDPETSLNYLNARYYEGSIGRFISQDPVFVAVGNSAQFRKLTGVDLNEALRDPQSFNSYSYARNNPIRYSDPEGLWWREWASGEQSTGDLIIEIGQATQHMTDNSAAWNYAVSNPKTTGALVGVLAAPAAEAGLSAVVAAKAAGAAGVGATYAAKQAAAATVYAVVAGTSLQAIPQTVKVLSAQDASNQTKYVSATYNVASQVVPTAVGGYVGAVSDILQFSKTVVDKLFSPTSSQSSTTSTKKSNLKTNRRP